MTWLLLLSCCLAAAPQELALEEYNQLHVELVPEKATWQSIPWQTSLIDAQNIAASENKPIFIWSMDGHPLGCT